MPYKYNPLSPPFDRTGSGSSSSNVQFLTGDSGTNPVGPDGAGNINIFGENGVTTRGVAASNSIFVGLDTTPTFPWTDVSGAFSPLTGNGYFITGTATGTLPAAPSQGDTIKFFIDHATQALTLQASGTQVIRFGTLISSAGGTATSTQQGNSVELVYREADTCWCVVAGLSGTWILV